VAFTNISKVLKNVYPPGSFTGLTQGQSPFRRRVSERTGKPVFQKSQIKTGIPGWLYLDIDNQHSMQTFVSNLVFLMESYYVRRIHIRPSSGEGVHVEVLVDGVPAHPFAWQAILGSDPIREKANVMDMAQGLSFEQANVLFVPWRCPCGEGRLSLAYPDDCMWCRK